jgi:glutathione S-transferase
MITNPAKPENLNVQRLIRAPRARVFQAWTNPDDILKWFGPGDCRALEAKVDLRVGGVYRFRVLTHGMEMDLVGVFHEITPPSRLVYTWQFKGGPPPDMPETLVTVEFVDQNGGTEVRIKHEKLPTPEARETASAGKGAATNWPRCSQRADLIRSPK